MRTNWPWVTLLSIGVLGAGALAVLAEEKDGEACAVADR
jgi:hypothetical protein